MPLIWKGISANQHSVNSEDLNSAYQLLVNGKNCACKKDTSYDSYICYLSA